MTWEQFAAEAPELASSVRAMLEATKHHVLATLRRDGSPRVSGNEVQFHGPDLVMGMMVDSVKARDLRRDGRYALHANPGDEMGSGDSKVSGLAVEVTDEESLVAYAGAINPPPDFNLFRLLLNEAVLTTLHPMGDRLVIERWQPGVGVTRVERV
ncbi:MAG TPA: hypothetical protein VGM78_10105 [Ilumatobacteraceae bacterium]